MINNIVNFVGTIFQPQQVTKVKPAATPSYNPFANPFVNNQDTASVNYGSNNPVKGGYFAGYYNGKPNIVGSRLFIEV